MDGANYVYSVTIDASGDVFAGGTLDNFYDLGDFSVVKLSGVTGAQIWRRDFGGAGTDPEHDYDCAEALAVMPGGDVVAVGDNPDCRVVRLSGASGSILWSWLMPNPITCQMSRRLPPATWSRRRRSGANSLSG